MLLCAKEANWLSHVLGVSANQYRMSNGRSLRHEPRAPELPFEVARDVFEEDDLTHKILPALRKVKTRRDVLSDFKGSLPEGQEPPPLAAVHGELRKTFVDFATQNVALVRRFCSSRSEALCFVNRMESQRVSTSLRFWATPERYVRQAKDCDLFGWHVDCKIGEREQVTVCFVVWDGDYAGRRGGDVQYWTRGLASFEQSRFRCVMMQKPAFWRSYKQQFAAVGSRRAEWASGGKMTTYVDWMNGHARDWFEEYGKVSLSCSSVGWPRL